MNKIKELLNVLNELYSKGYIEIINIIIYCYKSDIICQYNQNNYELNTFILYFKNMKKIMGKQMEIFLCKKNSFINLIYGRQFYYLYYNIINRNEILNLDLFKSISNSNIKKIVRNDSIFDFKIENFYLIIEQIELYINILLNNNQKTIKDIFIENKIKEEFKQYIGIYYYLSLNQDIDSLYIYQQFTDKLPISSCFLYCTPNTSSEELIAFIYRSIFCDDNILFCVINSELLNYSQINVLINTIKRFTKKNLNMKSCLLFIINNKNSDIYLTFIKNKNIQYFYFFNENDNIKCIDESKVEIITSKINGLGKSEKINEKFKLLNKNWKYIYFPLFGKLNKENLIKRVNLLPDMNDDKNYLIHIELKNLDEIFLAKEFFFKILILNKYDINENIKYFGNNIKFIIEISNDYINIFDEIKILSIFKIENIEILEKIKESKELSIVSNILSINDSRSLSNFNHNKILNREKSNELILRYLQKIGINNPNFYQINIFIKILYNEYNKFIKYYEYSQRLLKENSINLDKEENLEIRKYLIESLIKSVSLAILKTQRNVNKIIEKNNNIINLNEEKNNIEKDIKYIDDKIYNKNNIINFDLENNSLILFNEDGKSYTFITGLSEESQEFKKLEKIYNFQNYDIIKIKSNNDNIINNEEIRKRSKTISNDNNKKKYKNNFKKIRNLKSLDCYEMVDIVLNYLNINNINVFNDVQITKMIDNYVFTSDNFVKMILILQRIRAKIPTILIGEEGCGKYSIIKIISKIINKGKSSIYKIPINYGINDEDIIQHINNINKIVEKEDNILLENKKNEFKEYNGFKKTYTINKGESDIFKDFQKEIDKKIIFIFFEQLNTCNSMRLIYEILTKNTINGEPLDKRFIFIGSFNSDSLIYKDKIKNKFIKKNIVYNLNPLPLSLISNFVFDFGPLKKEDEEKYIKSMIKNYINLYFVKDSKEDENLCKNLIIISSESVILCHNFLKERSEKIINLNEIKKFLEFFDFFSKFLFSRKEYFLSVNNYEEINNEISEFYKNKTKFDIYSYSINLSLYICYYLKLVDNESRKTLVNIINERKFFNNDFLKIPIIEQNYIINNLEIEKGISKNKALKENLFVLFFCVTNNIPTINIGKSSSSKSLSIKILQSSMKGSLSKSNLCKKYPELLIFPIEGRENISTKEIADIFEKAKRCQMLNNDYLIVVFFDGMDIAEENKNNPLKVVYSELEQKNRINFIGTSNWLLDNSLMNKVIYNIIQEPDEEEIIEYGKELIKSFENKKEKYLEEKYINIIINLCKAYIKYNKNYENTFHSLSDFYSLIKSCIIDIIKYNHEIIENEDENKYIEKICLLNIERNFGGLKNSINFFKNCLFMNIDFCKKYNILECIRSNIYDKYNHRYLLLILENSISKDFLDFILKNKYMENINKNNLNFRNIKYFFGSKFKFDENNKLYHVSILEQLKYEMETESIIILKNLDNIYIYLYDLFNQNYIYLENKKFVNIGKKKSLSLLNDNFKLIILEDNDNISKKDLRFLKYFEKHIFSFDNLLNEELKNISNEIINVLNNIIKYGKNNNIINNLKSHLFFINNDGIKTLVYIKSKELECINKNKIIKYVLEKIIPFFSEELMILISRFTFKKNYGFYFNIINDIYCKNYCYNFKCYLEKLNNDISFVYTFSSINENIMDNVFDGENDIIKNNIIKINFMKKTSKEIKINSFLSMIKFKEKIKY